MVVNWTQALPVPFSSCQLSCSCQAARQAAANADWLLYLSSLNASCLAALSTAALSRGSLFLSCGLLLKWNWARFAKCKVSMCLWVCLLAATTASCCHSTMKSFGVRYYRHIAINWNTKETKEIGNWMWWTVFINCSEYAFCNNMPV